MVQKKWVAKFFVFALLLLFSCDKGNIVTVYNLEKQEADSLVKLEKDIEGLLKLRNQFMADGNLVGEMVLLKQLGKNYRENNRFIESIDVHQKGLKIAEELCDTSEMIQALNNIGTNHRRMSMLEEATKFHYLALELCEKYSDKSSYQAKKNKVISLNGIGNISLRIGDDETADSVFRKALAGERELGSALGQAINYANIGAIYDRKNMLDSAWVYYRKSMEMNEKANSSLGISLCHGYFGQLYEKEGNYVQALKEYEMAYEMKGSIDTWHWLNSCLALADIHVQQGNYTMALALLDNAKKEALDGQSQDHLASIYNLYYEVYSKTGHLNKAFDAYKLSRSYNDSILNQKNLISVQNERVRYEYQRRQQEIDNIQAEYSKERLVRNIIIVSMTVIVLLLITGVMLLMYSLKIKKREQETVKRLNEARTSFYTNITHEFRTPLTVIIGLGEKLSQKEDLVTDNGGCSIGNIIVRQGKQLLFLINQILDVAKLKTTVVQVDYQRGNIVSFVHTIVESAQELGRKKNVEVVFNAIYNDIRTNFVPDYITKIIGNLVSNAIKFSKQGGKVDVTIDKNEKNIIFYIKDKGCGIPADEKPYIFDEFYQGKYGMREGGTGVGLSLVKGLVNALKGSITLESEEDKGTLFCVTLPINNKTVTENIVHAEKPNIESVFTPNNLSLHELTDDEENDSDNEVARILIVDDNQDISQFIGEVVENAKVYYAENGKIAWDKAMEIVPDIIITDVMMPEVDGLELCEKIKQSKVLNHIPIIIVSAKVDDNDKLEGLKSGADAYLRKPFSAEELNITIKSLLERRRIIQGNISRNLIHDSNENDKISVEDQLFLSKFIDIVYIQMTLQRVNINDVAFALSMTPRQLNRKIHAITGENVSKYVLQIRMTKAKQLLDSDKDYTIAEIAGKCGYDENSNFTRAFKMLYNITPTQYRKRPVQ